MEVATGQYKSKKLNPISSHCHAARTGTHVDMTCLSTTHAADAAPAVVSSITMTTIVSIQAQWRWVNFLVHCMCTIRAGGLLAFQAEAK